MRYTNRLRWTLGVCGLLLLLADGARAEMVNFVTLGSFSGGSTPGTSTYTDSANGITIDFISSINNSVNVPPTSQVSFGTFDTSATTATSFAPISGTFTLTILQTSPTNGSSTFVGSLTGQLRMDNSQAFIQFPPPLTTTIGNIFYTIVSNDSGTPGRVNLAPISTNNGMTTIVGQVGVVPEPASIVMVALGGTLLTGLAYRRRGRAVDA